MEYEIAQSDLNEDTLQYEVNMNDPSYITWITSGAGGSFEDSSEWYEEDTNEYTTTALQEGAFTNDNQNYYDKILAATAGYNTSNVTNECFTVPSSQNTRNFSRNPNIKKSTEKDIVNETSDENMSQDKDDLDIYPKFQEHDAQEEPQDSINRELDAFETEKETLLLEEINRELYACEKNIDACDTEIQILLLENKELENRLRKALNKTYDANTEIEENEEPRDSIRKEDADEELTDADGHTVKEEPSDNMRNRNKKNNKSLSISKAVNINYQPQKNNLNNTTKNLYKLNQKYTRRIN